MRLALAALAICAAPAAAQNYAPPSFQEFIARPKAFAANDEFRAYLAGAALVYRLSNACPSEFDYMLRNTDRTISYLVDYGNTRDGALMAQASFMGTQENPASVLIVLGVSKLCAPR